MGLWALKDTSERRDSRLAVYNTQDFVDRSRKKLPLLLKVERGDSESVSEASQQKEVAISIVVYGHAVAAPLCCVGRHASDYLHAYKYQPKSRLIDLMNVWRGTVRVIRYVSYRTYHIIITPLPSSLFLFGRRTSTQ